MHAMPLRATQTKTRLIVFICLDYVHVLPPHKPCVHIVRLPCFRTATCALMLLLGAALRSQLVASYFRRCQAAART